jgi:hypothetical protein
MNNKPKALIAGHFSTRNNNSATFGDLEAMKVVERWLSESSIPHDTAIAAQYQQDYGVDISTVDPNDYDVFIFVCGPWLPVFKYVWQRFPHCLKVGIDLSAKPGHNHGFDVLIPRDRLDVCNPDLVFATEPVTTPLVGIITIAKQKEYSRRQRHRRSIETIKGFCNTVDYDFIGLSTMCYQNPGALDNARQFENMLRRLDLVITNRLHGLVFSIKNRVPVIAIDSVAGGAKVTAQAKAVDWPLIFNGDTVQVEDIERAAIECLDGSMRDHLEHANNIASKQLLPIKHQFIKSLNPSDP